MIDQSVDEGDAAQLGKKRGVEADFVDPAHDFARACRHFAALARIDLNNQGVLRCGRAQKRNEGRIGGIATVPIRDTFNFHRSEEQRKSGRGNDGLCAHLRACKYAQLSSVDVRSGDEEFQALVAANGFEVDETLD